MICLYLAVFLFRPGADGGPLRSSRFSELFEIFSDLSCLLSPGAFLLRPLRLKKHQVVVARHRPLDWTGPGSGMMMARRGSSATKSASARHSMVRLRRPDGKPVPPQSLYPSAVQRWSQS